MLIAFICERMRWTYTEYMEQPEWFIKTLLMKWKEDSEAQKNKTP